MALIFRVYFLLNIETSKESIQVIKDIIALKTDIETKRFPTLGSKVEKAQLLLNQLFQLASPIKWEKNFQVKFLD